MNRTQKTLAKVCPTQNRLFASGSVCVPRCQQGLPESSPSGGYDLTTERPPPRRSSSGPYDNSSTGGYRYTHNGNRYRIVRGQKSADETNGFSPCCTCQPPHCPRPKYCEAILGSVAEAQFTLSRMLNAEADKLDKAIEIADDYDQLLEINQETHRTLTAAIFLEQALYFKLQQMQEICGSCELGSLDTCKPNHP